MEIRNIAIIAHVDHGKTTLVDSIMRQMGMTQEGASMDSNDLEKERGITIYAKNTSLFYKDTKINIVDTPGHADFGSEVERVLRSIDSVLLLVDAQEGPMPQTRFVLKKSLELFAQPKKGRGARSTVVKDLGKIDSTPIQILSGKYGPYIKYGKKNISLPEGQDPQAFTLEQAKDLIGTKGSDKKKSSKGGKKVSKEEQLQVAKVIRRSAASKNAKLAKK
jgi:hypothetical protein